MNFRNALFSVFLFAVIGINFISCSNEESSEVNSETPAVTTSSVSSSEVRPEPLNSVVFELLMSEMMRSMSRWNELDQNLKTQAIQGTIDLLKTQQSITISKPASFYVGMLDGMVQGDNMPDNLLSALTIASIMEYDYDNGQDKDELARRTLGPQLYESNKQRRESLGSSL